MAQSVKGKTAIVTGAGSGINLEFARLLLQGGANVVIADLGLRPEAEELVKQYQDTPAALFHKTDVSRWSELEGMFEAAQKRFGNIDIVCPGAGVFEPYWSNFWLPPGTEKSGDARDGDRYKLLDINLNHPIRVTQLAISHFLSASPPASPSNPKSIVLIASIAGEVAFLPFPLYHISKHGIFGLIRSLSDLQRSYGIRVAGVAPGIVKTPLWTEHPEKIVIVNQEGENPDEWVTPQEVAAVMLALVEKDELNPGPRSPDPAPIPLTGGTIIEVGHEKFRDVPVFGNVGPSGGGHTIGNMPALYKEVYEWLGTPGWGKSK